MRTRIVVADDHSIFAEALAGYLNQVPEFQVVGVADEYHKVVPAVHQTSAAVLVVGNGLVHRLAALRQAVLSRRPHCAVTLIANRGHRESDYGGAGEQIAVVMPEARMAGLVSTIRKVSAQSPTCEGVLTAAPPAVSPEEAAQRLNPRELEILRSTVTGATIKEIARELYLAPGTVRNLASSAIKKLHARNRFDAARIAAELGWI